MVRYRDTLIIGSVALAAGLLMFVIVWALQTFNAGLVVGGTFWATGAFLGFIALRERR